MTADDDPRLADLDDEWLAAAEAGRLPTAADLSPDRPELVPALEARLVVLRRFRSMSDLPEMALLRQTRRGTGGPFDPRHQLGSPDGDRRAGPDRPLLTRRPGAGWLAGRARVRHPRRVGGRGRGDRVPGSPARRGPGSSG